MRARRIALAVLLLAAGCTHLELERRTIRQGSTIADLQYQQVLDNLALMACNQDAMPWHVRLRGGLIQVVDQGGTSLTAQLIHDMTMTPGITGQRNVLGQWDVEPSVDAGELEYLQLAYRKALNPADPAVNERILRKIGELSVRFDLLPDKEIITKILTTLKSEDEERKLKGKDKMEEILKRICRDTELLKKELQALDFRIVRTEIALGTENFAGKLKERMEVEEGLARLKEQRKSLEEKKAFKETQFDEFSRLIAEATPELTPGVQEKPRPNAEKHPALRPQRPSVQSRNVAESKQPGGVSRLTPQEASDSALLILTAIHAACPAGYLPETDVKWETNRNAGLIDQAEDQMAKFAALHDEAQFQTAWLWRGSKKDVPPCACHVGCYCGCYGDCCVWVMPDRLGTLRDFALIILTLTQEDKPDLFPTLPFAAPSPALR